MKNLRVKIAALFTAGMSIFPNVSFNVVKANDILKKDTFVENFQKKGITVYRTADNRLVDANLNYINVKGELLSKEASKVSLSDELKERISLHPVLAYVDENKEDFKFTKSLFNDRQSHIFIKTSVKQDIKMLYFNSKNKSVAFTKKIAPLVDPAVISEFGDAAPDLEDNKSSEKTDLVAKLQSEANSILKDKKTNKETKNNKDDSIAAVITVLVALAGGCVLLNRLLQQSVGTEAVNENWD